MAASQAAREGSIPFTRYFTYEDEPGKTVRRGGRRMHKLRVRTEPDSLPASADARQGHRLRGPNLREFRPAAVCRGRADEVILSVLARRISKSSRSARCHAAGGG